MQDNSALIGAIITESIEKLVQLSGDQKVRSRSRLSDDMGSTLVDLPDLGAANFFKAVGGDLNSTFKCLDLGCGNGPHRAFLEQAGAQWIGCDYAASTDPATTARHGTSLDAQVVKYDGRQLPFSDHEFDVVWSWQALEHIQEPELTFAEIARVLRPGGLFIGSTSFLEPYHAQSTYSYTPYGFKLICERHDMELSVCSPSLDGLSYIAKRISVILGLDDGPGIQRTFFTHSPLESIRKKLIEDEREEEMIHILAQLCGTFRFVATKS